MTEYAMMIAGMAAILEAGDRSNPEGLMDTPEEYVERAAKLYEAASEQRPK